MSLETRFTDGVWYDLSDESFCLIREREGDIVLLTPDGDDEYHTFSDSDEFIPQDFVQVPQQAVDDPTVYLQSFIDDLRSGCVPANGFSMSATIGIQYADEQTELSEK